MYYWIEDNLLGRIVAQKEKKKLVKFIAVIHFQKAKLVVVCQFCGVVYLGDTFYMDLKQQI